MIPLNARQEMLLERINMLTDLLVENKLSAPGHCRLLWNQLNALTIIGKVLGDDVKELLADTTAAVRKIDAEDERSR